MPTIGPYTFSVVVGGVGLHEYDPPVDEAPDASENKRVTYIEAVEGTQFELHCRCKGRLGFSSGHLGFHLYLDNERMMWQHLPKSTYHKRDGATLIFKRIYHPEGEGWVERYLQFSSLTTTDTTHKSIDLKQIARYAGSIRLAIFDQSAPTSSVVDRDVKVPKQTPITEKALKGQPIDMAAGFGEARPTSGRMITLDSSRLGRPLYQCVFKYRSRKALQMLDLIPTPPTPIALHERDPNTLDLAEARELISQIQRRDRLSVLIKHENSGIKQELNIDIAPEFSSTTKRKRKASSIARDETGSDSDDLIFLEVKKVKHNPVDRVEVIDLS